MEMHPRLVNTIPEGPVVRREVAEVEDVDLAAQAGENILLEQEITIGTKGVHQTGWFERIRVDVNVTTSG
jgi:hypothetical protein